MLLHETLLTYDFAEGSHQERPDDGCSRLTDCWITNPVRCVPPANKPETAEISACRQFLTATIGAMPKLRAIVALGRIAHDSTVRALGWKLSAHPFAHGARHTPPSAACALFDSYHCSRYDTHTGVLTADMFRNVFATVRNYLDDSEDEREDLHHPPRRVTI